MTQENQAPKPKSLIDLEFIFKVIENRGYQKMANVPSMNTLIYEKVKNFYVNPPKR